jgi:hypothetical protein
LTIAPLSLLAKKTGGNSLGLRAIEARRGLSRAQRASRYRHRFYLCFPVEASDKSQNVEIYPVLFLLSRNIKSPHATILDLDLNQLDSTDAVKKISIGRCM